MDACSSVQPNLFFFFITVPFKSERQAQWVKALPVCFSISAIAVPWKQLKEEKVHSGLVPGRDTILQGRETRKQERKAMRKRKENMEWAGL